MFSVSLKVGQRVRSPTTKNCAPQATAVCGCGERQPTDVQWKVSARGSLPCDQGNPSASGETRFSFHTQNNTSVQVPTVTAASKTAKRRKNKRATGSPTPRQRRQQEMLGAFAPTQHPFPSVEGETLSMEERYFIR
ncbi:hypothetical protein TNCV_3989371 [Trichonephila clavipes]|nr:hypothetical protein TNCV_3989371 [Trichonephila clavipes]